MRRAYWNEPSPLKQSYPKGVNSWEMTLQILGALCFMISLVGVLPGAASFPGTWQLFLILLLTPIAIGTLLWFIAEPIGRWHHEKLWKSTFIMNNKDLKLNYRAIRQVIHLLQTTTTYRSVNFREVAITLACCLRKTKPTYQFFSTFEHEVHDAYYHYHDGSREICPSACPRTQ